MTNVIHLSDYRPPSSQSERTARKIMEEMSEIIDVTAEGLRQVDEDYHDTEGGDAA